MFKKSKLKILLSKKFVNSALQNNLFFNIFPFKIAIFLQDVADL